MTKNTKPTIRLPHVCRVCRAPLAPQVRTNVCSKCNAAAIETANQLFAKATT